MRRTFEMCRRIDQVSSEGGDIYIRCAGNVGQQLCYELREMGINIRAFLDKESPLSKEVDGIPVLDPETVYQKETGSFFILIAVKNDSIYEEICNDLVSHGLKKGVDFADCSFNADCRMQDFMDIRPQFDFRKKFESIAQERMNDMKQVNPDFNTSLPDAYNLIPNLDVPLTMFCSMSCEYCSHCVPYAKPPKHYEPDIVADQLNKLLAVSYVACIGIMGGEPFVYPKLTEFIKLYGKLSNFNNIGFTRIVTNGTVVPKDDFFDEYRKIPNAYIYISNYGEKSKKIDELVEQCQKNGIKTYVCPYSDEWLLLGEVNHKREYSEKEIRHLYAVCGSHSCVQLLNGRVYACGRVPVLNEYGIIPFAKEDFCEISDDKDVFSENLHNYLYNKEYLEGCYYCDGQHMFSKRIHRGE